MANHNFCFAGGEILTTMGAAWFVSYAYYEKIDKTHRSWAGVSTAQTRISSYKRGSSFHRAWLQEILSMNPLRLEKNTIGLSSHRIKAMAQELLSMQEEKAALVEAIKVTQKPEIPVNRKALIACESQFVFGDFLARYERELGALRKNPGFVHELIEARGNVTPEVEFCTDQSNSDLRKFKEQINQHLHESKAYYDYPDFQKIVDDVQHLGIEFRGKEYTKKSAYISVYYALRYLKLTEK